MVTSLFAKINKEASFNSLSVISFVNSECASGSLSTSVASTTKITA